MIKKFKSKGAVITYALVFGTVFLIMLAGLLGFVLFQLKKSAQKLAWNEALQVAEAGVNYYRWCLVNDVESNCDLSKVYKDAAGNSIGEFSLTVSSETNCGEVTAKTIESKGWTYDFPNMDRTIRVLYGKPSVAKYAYLINDNVWAGADREIRGLFHSNGGIRMDGENQSLTTSALDEWICTDQFGCDSCPTGDGCRVEGSDCICPGVFTTTGNANIDLFDYPIPSFDFSGITIDLASVKAAAQPSPQQYYWPPSTDIDGEAEGYHFVFVNDGTFQVWIITDLDRTWGYSEEEDWHYDYFEIDTEYLYGTYALDSGCPLIFVEDNLWLEGEVKGKATIASANLISPTEETDVILSGEINYTVLDGSDGLGVISERNILIPPSSPDQMEIRGIFIAQNGRFGRNHYDGNIKTKLEIYGSIVSNDRVGTKWTSGSVIVSGYLERENYFDSQLIYLPPPFIPAISPNFEIVFWEEVE